MEGVGSSNSDNARYAANRLGQGRDEGGFRGPVFTEFLEVTYPRVYKPLEDLLVRVEAHGMPVYQRWAPRVARFSFRTAGGIPTSQEPSQEPEQEPEPEQAQKQAQEPEQEPTLPATNGAPTPVE